MWHTRIVSDIMKKLGMLNSSPVKSTKDLGLTLTKSMSIGGFSYEGTLTNVLYGSVSYV